MRAVSQGLSPASLCAACMVQGTIAVLDLANRDPLRSPLPTNR